MLGIIFALAVYALGEFVILPANVSDI